MKIVIEDVLGTMGSLRKVMSLIIKEIHPEEALSPGEIQALMVLYNNRSIHTLGEIQVCLGVSKGLVSRNLNALEERGLITFETDPADRRMKRAVLTEKGEHAAGPVGERMQIIVEEMFGDLNAEDVEAFKRVIMYIKKEANRVRKD